MHPDIITGGLFLDSTQEATVANDALKRFPGNVPERAACSKWLELALATASSPAVTAVMELGARLVIPISANHKRVVLDSLNYGLGDEAQPQAYIQQMLDQFADSSNE